jgi:ribose 5-phosphate isomerase B
VKIYTGSDHAGFSLRKTLVERLRVSGRDVVDLGTDSDGACDYPEFASAVGNAVRSDPGSLGILVCATGQGMAIAAGKVRGIRAVVPANVEAARLSRFDNDANVLCIAGRTMAEPEALAIVDTWLATGFAGGRHARRIAKVSAIETAAAVSFVTESERLGLAAMGIPARIFDRDASLFTADVAAQRAIEQSLAWLSLPIEMAAKIPEIMAFAEDVRSWRYRDVVLLVEDPAHSAIATMARLWGSHGLRMHVLGPSDTEPGRLPSAALGGVDATLVLVVEDEAGAVEAREHLLWAALQDKYCGDAQRAGQHFAAITTGGSRPAELALLHRYHKVFSESSGLDDIHRVFGFAGLVTAMLAGVDPGRLLAKVKAMADACRIDRLEANPGVSLGVLLGSMAKHGRNHVILLVSQSLRPISTWIGQLLSAATRSGRAEILVGTGDRTPTSNPPNRVFVQLQADDDAPAIAQEQMESLHIAGHPFLQIAVHDKFDILAEMYRWAVAATVAALMLESRGITSAPEQSRPKAGSEATVSPVV